MTEKEYDVGYARPPRHTRFRKGQSGNPRGRPRGHRNLASDLVDELNERIVVREGETRRTMTKQRGMLKALVARGLKGDTRAAELVLRLLDRVLIDEADEVVGAELDARDIAILERFAARNGTVVDDEPGTDDRDAQDEDPASD